MQFVGWFAIVVGLAIAGLWSVLLATHQVPELAEGRRDIVFHLGAEFLTALLLVGAGTAVLTTGTGAAPLLAALAMGALLYTTINSAGHYADLGQWPMVAMFGVLAAVTTVAAVVLFRAAAS
jgi:hypothetical protein